MRRTLALAGAAVLAVGITGLAEPAVADSDVGIDSHGGVFINEFSADLVNAGPDAVDGDFIELVNHGTSNVNIGNFEVLGCDATNVIERIALVPTGITLTPNQRYLIADSDYFGGGGDAPDQEFVMGAPSLVQGAGGLLLEDSGNNPQHDVRWGMPSDLDCANFIEAVDVNGSPVTPDSNSSVNFNPSSSPDSWLDNTPTPQSSTS